MTRKRKPYGVRRIGPEKAERLIRLFKKLGYEEHSKRRMRGKGSHVVLRHPETKKRIVIPVHAGKDVHPELIHGFLKQAGLRRKDYFELLDSIRRGKAAITPGLPSPGVMRRIQPALRPVLFVKADPGWILGAAYGHGVFAAGVEAAAGGGLRGRWRVALQEDAAILPR